MRPVLLTFPARTAVYQEKHLDPIAAVRIVDHDGVWTHSEARVCEWHLANGQEGRVRGRALQGS